MKRLFRSSLALFLIFFFTWAVCSGIAKAISSIGVSCKTCGICFAPLGICVLYFIIAILAIGLLLAILIGTSKKCPLCRQKCPKNTYDCPKCGYNFDDGFQSTLAIRVEDSPELMKLRGMTSQEPNKAALPPELCPKCKASLNPKSLFCGKCGERLR